MQRNQLNLIHSDQATTAPPVDWEQKRSELQLELLQLKQKLLDKKISEDEYNEKNLLITEEIQKTHRALLYEVSQAHKNGLLTQLEGQLAYIEILQAMDLSKLDNATANEYKLVLLHSQPNEVERFHLEMYDTGPTWESLLTASLFKEENKALRSAHDFFEALEKSSQQAKESCTSKPVNGKKEIKPQVSSFQALFSNPPKKDQPTRGLRKRKSSHEDSAYEPSFKKAKR